MLDDVAGLTFPLLMNQNQRNSAIIFRKNRTLRERRFYLICCVIKRLQYYIYGCAFDALHLRQKQRLQNLDIILYQPYISTTNLESIMSLEYL